MGKKDTVTKDYIRRPKIFADAFNQFVYHGKQEVLPELLRELDTTEIAVPYGDDGVGVPEQRYRDSLKLLTAMTDESRAFCVLGIESQADIHYAIPVKNGLYDFLQLAKQVSEAAKSHREKAEAHPTSGEYLSGFWKTDRLLPVVTLVIYFGPEEWDGPLTLREMYDCDDEELLTYAADYHVNLLAPGNMTDEEIALFHTDLREVMQYIKYSQDKEKIAEILTENKKFWHMDRETVEVINTVTNSKLRLEEKEDSVDMCLALDQIREDCRAEGRARGLAEMVLELLAELGEVPKEICDRIEREKDLDTLKKWLRGAVKAESIADFVGQLNV